jgi:hypothetical protein
MFLKGADAEASGPSGKQLLHERRMIGIEDSPNGGSCA